MKGIWGKVLGARGSVQTTKSAQIEHVATVSPAALILKMNSTQTDKDSFCLLYSKLAEVTCGVTNSELIGDATLTMKRSDGEQMTIMLENLWRMCRQNPDEGAATIERHLKALLEARNRDSPMLDRIVPTIKDEVYIRSSGDKPGFAYLHFVADLYIVFATDREHSISTVSVSELKSLRLSLEEALELGKENLRRILPAIECHGDGPWHFLTAGGDYVASLLLLDSVWEFVAHQVDGDIVASVPARDSLLFSGASSTEGVAEVRRLSTLISSSGDHLISNTMLRRVDGKWKVFD